MTDRVVGLSVASMEVVYGGLPVPSVIEAARLAEAMALVPDSPAPAR